MDILIDENIPLMTVAGLRELGHDVKDVRGTGQQGLPDADLWALALAEKRMGDHHRQGFHRTPT
jgi:predicted nuclease of predicted toxin-antitoxin system